jgi:nicotinate-nucleotide pyrophosphorylase (carboxylating)
MFPSEIERLLAEDLGEWDDSTMLLPSCTAKAVIVAKEPCVISGLTEACEIFRYLGVTPLQLFDDGEFVTNGAIVMAATGEARDILRGERLALNILGRMSGISTLTRECVLRARSSGRSVVVAGTRKTTPGFRRFEKRAIFLGGGDPHRFNLSGAVMVKDNHIQMMGIESAVAAARRCASFTKKIEVEVESIEEAQLAASLKADIIMFDNMPPEQIRVAVEALCKNGLREGRILEASGGITPNNIEEYAATGVDVVSLGAITKDARWIDLGLDMEPVA